MTGKTNGIGTLHMPTSRTAFYEIASLLQDAAKSAAPGGIAAKGAAGKGGA